MYILFYYLASTYIARASERAVDKKRAHRAGRRRWISIGQYRQTGEHPNSDFSADRRSVCRTTSRSVGQRTTTASRQHRSDVVGGASSAAARRRRVAVATPRRQLRVFGLPTLWVCRWQQQPAGNVTSYERAARLPD